MEQNDSNEQTTHKFDYESDSCYNLKTHYCSVHNQFLCSSCMIDFHEKSKTNEKHGIKEVTDQIYIIKSLLSLVQSDHEHIKACSNTDNFDKELRLFNDILSMIDKKLTKSIENNKFNEFVSIMEEVFQLQKELIDSALFAQISKSAEFKQAFVEGILSRQMITELQITATENTSTDFHEKEPDQSDDSKQDSMKIECLSSNKQDKVENIDNEKSEKAVKEQVLNIHEEEKFYNHEMIYNLKQSNERAQHMKDNGHADEAKLEKQKHEIIEFAPECIQKKELDLFEHERKIQEVVFTRIYERRIGKKEG